MLQIEYSPVFPAELEAPAAACLREAISFLESVPRPMAKPEIEYLTPNFSEMKFTFGENNWSHGLFSTRTGAGWCVLDYASNGSLQIESTPIRFIENVDPNICTTAGIVYVLDQLFYTRKHPELNLQRQLQWLDTLAPANAKVKSLLVEYGQQLQQQEEQEKQEAYKQQLQLKQYLWRQNLDERHALRIPAWYCDKWEDSPVCEGAVITGARAPAPSKATAQLAEQSEPQPYRQLTVEEQVEAFALMEAEALGQDTARVCEDYDK